MDDRQRYALHAAVFAALSNPVRHELFHILCEKPRSPGELAEILRISKPNVSQHLAVLKNQGLVTRRREDGRVLWTVTDARLTQACALVDEVVGRELHSRLAAIEREAPHVPEE
jgi:DNA-binding transcriptional ArsR family regulator